MLYSTIYSIDVPGYENIDNFLPPASQYDPDYPDEEWLWAETEDDEQYEFDYLEGDWETGHHRKLVALLNQEEFDEFIGEVHIYAEDVETGGSLGAPGFGFGWAPAISFTDYDSGAILNAYVSPIPGHLEDGEIVPDENVELPLTDEDWERARKEIIEKYS